MTFYRFFRAALVAALLVSTASAEDARNIRTGLRIPDEGYCDQPYVVITRDGNWLCTMTTGTGHEGDPGQHVVATVSRDQGQTWSDLIDIEPASGPEASWVVPLVVPSGRVYAFHTYNGERINELDGREIRADMLGWYVFKYSDDNGRTWSQRYRLPISLGPSLALVVAVLVGVPADDVGADFLAIERADIIAVVGVEAVDAAAGYDHRHDPGGFGPVGGLDVDRHHSLSTDTIFSTKLNDFMNSVERVHAALRLQQRDCVPVVEFVVDDKVARAATPGCRDVADCMDRLELDGGSCGAFFGTVRENSDGSYVDEWGGDVPVRAGDRGASNSGAGPHLRRRPGLHASRCTGPAPAGAVARAGAPLPRPPGDRPETDDS